MRVTWVIPCFNEAKRLDPALVASLVSEADVSVVLVDDGSKDETLSLLEAIAAKSHGRVRALGLPKNVGKAEAVRAGLRAAMPSADVVGYADADFATPPHELLRLTREMRQRGVQALLGSRVALAGRDIHRSPMRHYLGRAFGTVASWMLSVVIYDTQCGAKLFKVGPHLEAALDEPFGSRWVFDVELLGRLLAGAPGLAALGPGDIVEVPLEAWKDVGGSKLKLSAMAKVPFELAQVARRLETRRRRALS